MCTLTQIESMTCLRDYKICFYNILYYKFFKKNIYLCVNSSDSNRGSYSTHFFYKKKKKEDK